MWDGVGESGPGGLRPVTGPLRAPSFLISKMGLIFLLRMVIAGIKINVECESILPVAHNPSLGGSEFWFWFC